MARFRSLASRLAALLRRRELDQRLGEELQFHLRMQTEENIRRGMAPSDARAAARGKLGNLTQASEEVYRMNTISFLEETARNIRLSLRTMRKSPGFALGVASLLALAIGANTAIFSVVHTVLLQPLPYPGADRIVLLETLWTNTGRSAREVSGPNFLDWQAQNDVFATMALYYGNVDSPVVLGDRAVFANPLYVSADFFAVFGQTASAGRLLTGQDVPAPDGMPTTAVVAHSWAVTHFGGAAAAVGKTITTYGSPMQIVGVAAPGFRYPGATDIWAAWPIGDHRNQYEDHAVGRLKPGVDFRRAQAEMRTIGDNLARQYPENRLSTVNLIPLQERLTGNLRATLWVLMAAVGVVWIIACANIANLLLARATGRTGEIALRAALGAGQGRVVRHILAESCVLGGMAGVGGLALAFFLVQGVVAWAPANLPRIEEVRMDTPVLLFALGLSMVSTALFGLIPAVHASRLDLSDALKQGGSKATASKTSARLRSALVVAEVALSVVLLASAGLLLQSFDALNTVDLGFTKERVLVAYTEYVVRDGNEDDSRARIAFFSHVLDRLRAVPGVSAAAGVAYVGMGWEPRTARDYYVQGHPDGQPGERPQAEFHAVTPDYFKTLEIPILSGRDFARTDTPDTAPVIIINQTLARMAFPGESPIGKFLKSGSIRGPWTEIVGVVGDTRWQEPSRPAPPVIYASTMQGLGNSPSIIARTSLDEGALATTIRTLLHEADPTVPVKFKTMEELFGSTLAYPRFRTQVIGLFAGMAVLLAAVGIFSVLAYLVGQRTRELAVRRALGAQAGDVIRLIVGQGLRLVAIGLALGLAGALAVARLLTGLLYEIGPWDAVTYLGTIAVLGGAALLATLLPAIRAAAIAPVVVLRQE